jgi:putative transposase
MYEWRKMTAVQRKQILGIRRQLREPWHSPPHHSSDSGRYLITAACFEHRPVIGVSADRMADFTSRLLGLMKAHAANIHAWVVLPNHYHVLAEILDVIGALRDLGRLHGRTSFEWNGQDKSRGRQVWCKAAETGIKSERHFWAALNYVHHNPVKHGYTSKWQDWPFSSAAAFIESVGRARALEIWQEYPVLDFGKEWDAPEM